MRTPANRTRARRRSAVAALIGIAAAGAVLAGCGDSDGKATTSEQATTTTAAEQDAVTTTTGTAPAGFALRDVDWEKAVTLDCGTGSTAVGTKVLQVVYATPTPGTEVAVVLARCDAGAGSPPTSLLVYDGAAGPTAPHLLQTLLDGRPLGSPPAHPPIARTVAAAGQALSAKVDAYSSADVPSCCPDRHHTVKWQWAGGSYQLLPA
ncbi:MAG TPA: hypothetical protein VFJ61_04665 [Solirubrobacterales bacterium]|nr:hypothetical protein [Solirubrobacterales bacterium]